MVLFALSVLVGTFLEPTPPLKVSRVVSVEVDAAGKTLPPPWPATGESALASGTGQLIGTHGPDRAVPIGSIAKVMTAYLVLQKHPLKSGQSGFNMTVTASDFASMALREAEGQSIIGVYQGEVLSERQALEALLIPSADNIADFLAAYIGPTQQAFIAEMNSTAKRLGLTHTHFADASGYSPGSRSNSTDLIKLGLLAMKNPTFAKIVDTYTVRLPNGVPGAAPIKFTNYNGLLGSGGFDGIKTGSTPQAGQALLFSVRRKVGGHEVSIVGDVLEQHGPGVVGGALSAAQSLVDGYFARLGLRTALPAGTVVARLSRAGQTAFLSLRRPLQVWSLPGEKTAISFKLDTRDTVRGESARVSGLVPAFPPATAVARAKPLPPPGFFWKLEHFF